MIQRVSKSDLESVSRGIVTAFGAESEFRDFVGCSCYKEIPIGGGLMEKFDGVVADMSPKTFPKQLIQSKPCWANFDCDSGNEVAHLYWLH